MIIAQISDPHIKPKGQLAYGHVDTAGYLEAAVKHLNELALPPEATLVTGDICDFGLPEEYEQARLILDGLQMPWFVVPGNHDRPDTFRAAFGDLGYLPDDGFLHYVIDDFPVRMIGLDTTLEGEAGGAICELRRHWLSHRLNEELNKPTLLFMHHPPFLTGIRHMDVQNCAGGDDLGALLAAHSQVQMLLCGHVHRAISANWHGKEVTICPSPAHAVSLDLDPEGPPMYEMEPPACRLVYLSSEGRLVSHLSFIGEFEGPKPFFDDSGVYKG